MSFLKRGVGFGAVGLALATLSTGIVWAFPAVVSPVIHACANNRTGALRLAARCAASEHVVIWGVQGARGPAGPVGPAGASGRVFGFVSAGDNPPVLQRTSVVEATTVFTMPASGQLWVTAHFLPNIVCSGACSIVYGIYVDGIPVTGGRRVFTGSYSAGPVESWGISQVRAKGQHRVSLAYTATGSLSSISESVTVELGGMLL